SRTLPAYVKSAVEVPECLNGVPRIFPSQSNEVALCVGWGGGFAWLGLDSSRLVACPRDARKPAARRFDASRQSTERARHASESGGRDRSERWAAASGARRARAHGCASRRGYVDPPGTTD